jgi:hypothetical protein
MSKQITRRRLLASAGGLAGLALGATAGAVPAAAASADELPLRWNRTYAPNRINGAVSAIERDGQYVVLGTTGQEATQTSGWLYGVDAASGAGQWQTTVENSEIDRQPRFQTHVDAPDGDGFTLLGARFTEGVASLVRTGPEGSVSWWEEYGVETDGGESGTFLSSSLVATEEGYFVCGSRLAGTSISAVVVSAGLDGSERSRTVLFQDERSNLLDAVPDGEGGLIVVGQLQERTTSATDRPQTRAVVARLNPDLSVAWDREFTAPGEDPFQTNLLRGLTATSDGYAAVGTAAPAGGQSAQGWVLLLDAEGSERASRLFDPSPITTLTGVVEAADGLTVVGQLAESATSAATTGWVAELAPDGTGRWNRSLAPASTNNLVEVIATSDDGVALVGTVQAESQDADPRSQGWLVKLGGEPAPSVTSTASGDTDTPESTPTDTPEPTPTDTPEPTATPTPITTPTRMVTETPEDGTTSGSGPGFGAVGAVTALGAGALYRHLADDGE